MLPEQFDPETSAAFVRSRLALRTKVSLEIVKELYLARDYYFGKGNNQHRIVSNETTLTSFEKYLAEIQLPRPTAYRWLDRYEPNQDKLLTSDEYESRKKAEAEAKKTAEQRKQEEHLRKVREEHKEFEGYYKQGKNPDFADKTKQERWKSFRAFEDRMKKERERIEDSVRDKAEQAEQRKRVDEEVKQYLAREQEKLQFRIKHATQITNLDTFYDVIDDFLQTVGNTSRQIETLNGIIKYCRDKANRLHSQT